MRRKTTKTFILQRIWGSKLFVVIGVVVLIYFSVALGKEITRRVEVSAEISSIQDEIHSLEGENKDLNALLAYLNTDTLVENEARMKLGMQEAGESVVVVPVEESDQQTEQLFKTAEQQAEDLKSNPQKWWEYFFKS